jgi:hypothetical protein
MWVFLCVDGVYRRGKLPCILRVDKDLPHMMSFILIWNPRDEGILNTRLILKDFVALLCALLDIVFLRGHSDDAKTVVYLMTLKISVDTVISTTYFLYFYNRSSPPESTPSWIYCIKNEWQSLQCRVRGQSTSDVDKEATAANMPVYI